MLQNFFKSDRILFVAFLILFIWLPLPFGSHRVWALSIAEIWVMLIAVAWLWLYLQDNVKITEAVHKAKFAIYCFALFVGWVFFQCIELPVLLVKFLSPEAHAIQAALQQSTSQLTVNVDATFNSAVKTLCLFLFFLLALLLLRTTKRIKYFAIAIVISGLFQAVYGSLMSLSGIEVSFFVEKEASRGAATGTFVNRNHLAGYLEMSLAVGIGLMIATLSRRPASNLREWIRRFIGTLLGAKARLRIALAIMVIALILTQSRMGNTAFFVSLAIAGLIGLIGLWWLSRQGKISSYAIRPVLILFLSLIIIDTVIVGAWFGIDKVKDRIEKTSFASEIRDEVDINTIDHFQSYWLTGSGGGTFAEVFPGFKTELFPGYIDHAHNDYLEFASEFGIIGLFLLSLVVLMSLSKAVQAQFIRRSYFMRGIGFSATMGIVAILLHSTVDFNLQIPANAALFVILLAFSWLACYTRSDEN